MPLCLFASDLHGRTDRYAKLFAAIEREVPSAVFLGGDLLPMGRSGGPEDTASPEDFLEDVVAAGLERTRSLLGNRYPEVFLIFGNDDPRSVEPSAREAERQGTWRYAHMRRFALGGFSVYGYACVPPTPFRLKDWERYDVSRHVDPGALSPEEGVTSVPGLREEARFATIQKDLETLAGADDLTRSILLFHSPPYDTPLDRAALDGRVIDHVPLDLHVGSIAIRRFIEERRPRVTLHGHVHESARLTGTWRARLGDTDCLSAAHDGPELALVRFDPESPGGAVRELL